MESRRHHLQHALGYTALVVASLVIVAPLLVSAETPVSPGGTTTILPPLNAGANTQQKLGSLAIGDSTTITKLCLNADPAQGTSDTTNCISSWSSIASTGGSYVAVSSNLLSIGTPPSNIPALIPANYTLQIGAADVKALSGQQAAAIVRAPDVVFCDTVHTLCQSGSRYGQACTNDSQCPGAPAGSCRVGGICLDPREPHACTRNSDCGYNATGVFANGGATGVAGQFNGTLYIQSVGGSAGQICLGHSLGPVCYSSWSQLATAPSYVKRFSPLPKPLTPQGAGLASRYGAVISGSASFGSAVLGDSTGLAPGLTCGDGICNGLEDITSCAVDCGGVNAPAFSPTVRYSSAPPALPQIELNIQAAIQNPTAATILVVRSTGQAPTFVPIDGVTYTEGAVIGNSTIVKKVSTTSGVTVTPPPVDTLPSVTGTYYYRTFQANTFPRYSPGSATFPITIYTLTAAVNPAGSATIAGSVNDIRCNSSTENICQAYYVAGTTETLSLDALNAGYRSTGWSGCTTSDLFNCEVNITANVSVTLITSSSGGGGGGGSGPCFAARTLVDTPFGPVPIERLHVGDSVNAYDERTGRTVISHVTDTMVHPDQPYGIVTLEGGNTIHVTSNHPFYDATSHTWREIGTMKAGDVVLRRTANGLRPATISSLSFVGETTTVYNISVENQHNYFVSGVLVHNKLSTN